jgi:hypothetical protein
LKPFWGNFACVNVCNFYRPDRKKGRLYIGLWSEVCVMSRIFSALVRPINLKFG